jgi:type I restriction enzyme, S subunit
MIDLVPLDKLLSVVIDNRGKTCPTAESGLPLIATNCVKNATLFPTLEKVRYVSDKTYRQWFRGHPEPGDLIFVTKGAPGQVCVAPEPVNFCIAQDMVALRANDAVVDPLYLFAALRSRQVQDAIANMHVGTMIPHFKKGDFDKLLIPRPHRRIQQFIGDMYFRVSHQIELNHRMNETLEAMTRAIFKDWFVDFGPTRAKMEGRAPYLTPELWSLFPDRFDDEGKPKGWRQYRLEELVTHSRETMSPSDFPIEVFEHYSLPAFDAGKYPALDLGSTIKSNKTVVPSNGVLLSKLNPDISRVWLPDPKEERSQVTSTEFLAFEPKGLAGRSFVYCVLTNPMFKVMLEGMVTGTSRSHQRISPPALLSREVVTAEPRLIAAIELLAAPLLGQQLANRSQSRTLATIRDFLLPRLISGEICVKDAEKIAAAA